MILGIYGASGLGREVYELAISINNNSEKQTKIVFIDDADKIDNPRNLSIYKYSEIKNNFSLDEIEFCIAIGEPIIRKKIFDNLTSSGMKLTTLIHPDVTIPKSTLIGEGTIICKFVSITCDIVIGDNVYIHPFALIGHDAVIGDNVLISSYVFVAGNCKIGSCTFLAVNVILKQSVSIGENTIVGIGSVVHRDLPDGVIALGNPDRPMNNNIDKKVFK